MDWSAPDPDGVQTCRLTDPQRASLKGQRRLRRGTGQPLHLDTWPADERALLAEWVRRACNTPLRHEALLRSAGATRAMLADRLLARLLRLGALEIEEHHDRGHWWPRHIRFLDPARLRRELGLPEPDAARLAWDAARTRRFEHPELDAAAAGLDALPPTRALARHALLVALSAWQAEARSGTWRDFAQFARGDTKQISDAEKNWLASALSLADLRISGHTPLLLLRAPSTLVIDKREWPLAAPDFIALTPATLAPVSGASHPPSRWRLVENRTSFERVARTGDRQEGVLWLPGYPPSWWRDAVIQLLRHLPAPASIACDPDPDGIAIALQAGALWSHAGLDWQAWKMAPADLTDLPVRRPLDERDRSVLARLLAAASLPATLRALAEAMLELDAKGEQEGLL